MIFVLAAATSQQFSPARRIGAGIVSFVPCIEEIRINLHTLPSEKCEACPICNSGTQAARPLIPFKDDLFWAQGLNAGLRVSW